MTGRERPPLDYAMLVEAIDALKARKARPDKTRICHHLERKWGFVRSDVLAALSSAVRDGTVLKVRYKDYYSYRVPVKAAKSSPKTVASPETNGATRPLTIRRIVDAIQSQLKTNRNSGVSLSQLLNALHSKKQLLTYDETILEKTLRQEMDTGCSIRMLDNGRYTLSMTLDGENADVEDVEPSVDEEEEGSELSIDSDEAATRKIVVHIRKKNDSGDSITASPVSQSQKRNDCLKRRPVSQRKKIKKSLGPDFLDPSDLGYQYLRDTYEPKCRSCHLSTTSRRDELLSCGKCGIRVHESCLTTEGDVKSSDGQWFCLSCTSVCGVCKKRSTTDEIVFCHKCKDGFHFNCLNSKSKAKLNIKSISKLSLTVINLLLKRTASCICMNCSAVDQEQSVDDSDEPELMQVELPCPTTSQPSCTAKDRQRESVPNNEEKLISSNVEELLNSKVPEKDELMCSMNTPTNDKIAQKASFVDDESQISTKDPMEWSVDEVVRFIRNIGFPDEACRFRDQEIDGRSLLLMKRVDVLTGLSIKLGPALKIYAHIFYLQGTKTLLVNPFDNDSSLKLNAKKCGDAVSMTIASPALVL